MTHLEDSYEGAVRRLERLGHQATASRSSVRMTAPLSIPRPARANEKDSAQLARMRDLEALAALACEENERLERELSGEREARAVLLRRISMLEETIADPRRALGLPALAPALAPAAPRGKGLGTALVALLGLGALAAASFALRPWQQVPTTSLGWLGLATTRTIPFGLFVPHSTTTVPTAPSAEREVVVPVLAAATPAIVAAAPDAARLAVPAAPPVGAHPAAAIIPAEPPTAEPATVATTRPAARQDRHPTKKKHTSRGGHKAKAAHQHKDDPLSGIEL